MPDYSEDFFANTRMSFGDHIEELRIHLWRAIIGFFIALCFSFLIGRPVEGFITKPVEEELMKLYDKRVEKAIQESRQNGSIREKENQQTPTEISFNRNELARALGIKEPAPEGDDSVVLTVGIKPVDMAVLVARTHVVNRPPSLVALSATEGFMVYMKVCLYLGIVLSSPWLFYQIWGFVAAGLYPNEKRYVNLYLPLSLFLFLAGVALCEFVVIPKALAYLLGFNEWMGLENDLRLNEWLTFAILMPLMFGIAFQTPLVMLFLERLGIVTVEYYQIHRKYAIMGLAVLAAVIAPSPDMFSILTLTIGLICLYELGIIFCRLSPRKNLDVDVPEPDEMVEV